MKRFLLIALLALSLPACKTVQPTTIPVIQTVSVPVPVPCRPRISDKPTYEVDLLSDDDLSAMEKVIVDGTDHEKIDEIFQDLLGTFIIDRSQRMGRELELETAIAGCAQ